jgi:transcriptional repressor NrdR
MKCPFCTSENHKVIDSRDSIDAKSIRRRRECLQCGNRFTTFENIELAIQVHKRDGRYEDFQQQKLISGIEAACRHTKISREQVIELAARITGEIQQGQVREISTKELGDIVMQHLLAIDPIAYIRFACVYRRFQDIHELMEAIKSIQAKDAHQLERKQNKARLERDEEECHAVEKK